MTALPDLTIRQFEYLVAVADSNTWALAAERVGVSGSALSQGIAELERRLGVDLFDRDGRRRRLRTDAAPVLAHARQVLALTGDLADWAQRVRTGSTGRLRLGMIDAAAIVHFGDHLRRFRAARTDVELRLRVEPSGPLLDLLIAGDLDVVVCVAPPQPIPGISTTPLLIDDVAVYAPATTRPGSPSTWGPWVLFPEGSHTRAAITHELQRLGAPLDIVAESHQPDVLREMVRLGTGWTALPRAQADHGAANLVEVRTLLRRELVAAVRDGAVRQPVVDDLITSFSRHASESTGHSTALR
ncbi:MAG: LysR family transcriptional regulator [Actinomycetota bacterium]